MKVKEAKAILLEGKDIRAIDKGGDTIILRKCENQVLIFTEDVLDKYAWKHLGSALKDHVKEII